MNLAKLTTDDLPLFIGITSDLFPGIQVPAVDYDELIGYITNEAIKLKLQVNLWELLYSEKKRRKTLLTIFLGIFFFF